jgi:hypothetical protein
VRRCLLLLCLALAGCGGAPRVAPTVRPSATLRPTVTAPAPNSPTSAPTTAPTATVRAAAPTTAGYTCDQCIKGNINSAGEKIYHLPGCRDYERTEIDTSRGERLFSSEAEARAAGWRIAANC